MAKHNHTVRVHILVKVNCLITVNDHKTKALGTTKKAVIVGLGGYLTDNKSVDFISVAEAQEYDVYLEDEE